MSAPAVRHDLRCAQISWAGPDVSCTCRQTAPMARLSPSRARACSFCGDPAAPYQINPTDRACREHAMDVIDHHLDTGDGFLPVTVARVQTGGAA